jgi:hypothetical protein
MKLRSIIPVASTAVGKRGTRPVSKIGQENRDADRPREQGEDNKNDPKEGNWSLLLKEMENGPADASSVAIGV